MPTDLFLCKRWSCMQRSMCGMADESCCNPHGLLDWYGEEEDDYVSDEED